MKKFCLAAAVFLIFSFKSNAQRVIFMPFDLQSLIYGGDTKKSIEAELSMMSGLRIETSPFAYFDVSFNLNIKKLPSFFHFFTDKRTAGEVKFVNASLNFPNLGAKYLSTALFWGKYDELGSQAVMREYVKRKLTKPEFRKFYPSSAFKPNTDIDGLGLALYGAGSSGFYGGIYTYWNSKLGKDFVYTNDLRFGGAAGYFVFDIFAGFSSKIKIKDSKFKFGMSGFLDAEEYGLYFEAGAAELPIARLNAETIQYSLYALFEPRINKKIFNAAFSFFISPIFTLPQNLRNGSLDKSSLIGLNSVFGFGNLDLYNINGGISILTTLNPKNASELTPFSFCLSPFVAARVGKAQLDARIPINPLMYKDLRKAIIGQFSMKVIY